MDPMVAGLMTGGASLLGSWFSSDTSAKNTQAQIAAQEGMQAQTEQFNAQQSQLNRDFQAQMSNTAYQRASQDMQKAGLNPMMMFGSGGAASSPSGGSASVGTPSVPMPQTTSPLAGIGDAVGKVFSTAGAVQGLTKQQADIDLTRAEKHLRDEQSLKTNLEGIATGKRLDLIPHEVAIREAESQIERNKATTAKNEQSMDNDFRRKLDIGSYGAGKIGDIAKPIIDAGTALTSSALKKRGLDLLEEKTRGGNSATSFRRGYDAGLRE